jgi:Carboxypeptidase regulatory-like domain
MRVSAAVSRTLLVLGIAVLAVVVIIMTLEGPSAPRSGPVPIADNAERSLPGSIPLSTAPDAPSSEMKANPPPEPFRADPDGTFTLRGRVLAAGGEAAVGARVTLSWLNRSVEQIQRLAPHRTRFPKVEFPKEVQTDRAGAYELPCRVEPKDAPVLLGWFRVLAQREDQVGVLYLLEVPAHSFVLPDLVLEQGVNVRLRYLNLDDEPVSGVRARLQANWYTQEEPWGTRQRRTSDLQATGREDGRLTFRPIPARQGMGLFLTSNHPDYPSDWTKLDEQEVLAGGEIEVYLPRSCTLYGTVLDERRRPIAGAVVVASILRSGSWDPDFMRLAVTDRLGWFELKGVAEGFVRPLVYPDFRSPPNPGEEWNAIPHVFDETLCESGSPIDVGSLSVPRTGTVKGVVTKPDGKPAAGAIVYTERADGIGSAATTVIGADGCFTLNLPPGRMVLKIYSEKVHQELFLTEIEIESGEETILNIELTIE